MKKLHFHIIMAVLVLLTACGGGCASQKAREATFPQFKQAWQLLRVHVEREAEAIQDPNAGTMVADADAAMEEPTLAKMSIVAWGSLEDLANADIDRREAAQKIGKGLAGIQRRTVIKFHGYRVAYINSLKQ